MQRLIAIFVFFASLFAMALGGCSTNDGVTVPPPTDDASVGTEPAEEATETPAAVCAKSCKGCCIEDGTCVAKPTDAQCGAKGKACVACTGDDRACIDGACGCTSNKHCATGLICDRETSKCKKPCTAGSCATGCCSTRGYCETGMTSAACGTSGTCIDCTGNAAGTACLGTKCGCNSKADCPTGQACDATTKTCTTSCSESSPCNGGCCNGATGKCSSGTLTVQCGTSGGMCADCTGNPAGSNCVSGACGCVNSYNCPVGEACGPTKKCSTSCSEDHPCNGGCCSGSTCAPGTADSACGTPFTMCKNCSASTLGATCLTVGGNNRVCGCEEAGDCSGVRECKFGAGRSTKWCCLPTGSFCVIGNNECCSGSCSGINGNTKCN